MPVPWARLGPSIIQSASLGKNIKRRNLPAFYNFLRIFVDSKFAFNLLFVVLPVSFSEYAATPILFFRRQYVLRRQYGFFSTPIRFATPKLIFWRRRYVLRRQSCVCVLGPFFHPKRCLRNCVLTQKSWESIRKSLTHHRLQGFLKPLANCKRAKAR